MADFVYGINNDGYIYGRLFKSVKNNGQFVIDIGEKEYHVDGFEVEVWDGLKYIPTTANDNGIETKLYGSHARFKENAII